MSGGGSDGIGDTAGGGVASPQVARWRRALRWAWVVLVLAAAGVALQARWDDVRTQLESLEPSWVAASMLLALAGVGASALVWRALLAGLGSRLGARDAAAVFFVGQLGKYLPGSVWPVVAQAELGRDRGVPGRASVAAAALFMWVHLLSGAAVAAVGLPLAGVAPPVVALIAVPALALVAPGLLGRAVSGVLRLVRREQLAVLPDARAVARALGWSAVMWALYGLHIAAAATALDIPGLGGLVVDGLALGAGAYAAAWCAGFLFVVAPAGAGVRELVLVGLLAPSVGTDAALVVAVVSRLGVTVADLGWGVAGLSGTPRRRS